MASENETVEDVVKEMLYIFSLTGLDKNKSPLMDFFERIKAAHQREVAEMKREVAELRECLNEAIREKCPFTRMSCKHGEPCEYVCGTDKWRKALEGAKDEGK